MTSDKRRARTCALILASMTLAAGGCATGRPIVVAQSACSSLVGPSLRADVPPIDLPPAAATAGDLWVALDGQTGRLDTANTYKKAILETVQACEARDAASVKKIMRPWWKVWG